MRSLISAERRHIVYFPGGSGSHHIQRLNTLTHECETIKLLTFAPRCLVAQGGWLCCGSENGDFVAVGLEASSDGGSFTLDLDADARLPLGLDSSTREDTLRSLISRARASEKSFIAKSSKMAKDRVNCITLWFPPSDIQRHDGAYTWPVAVLANNDRTVTLVNIQGFDPEDKSEPLSVITYPDFVNRAIISPDGKYLVAILDDPYLYVHERTPKLCDSPRHRDRPEHQWELKQRILLKSQRKDDKTDSRGSFAACFSSSGAFLAVGTQHGTISIFDASLLSDEDADPLITTFKSSRPESPAGAIRDMAFCPGPHDILAWTEDRRFVGIADMRSNFVVRQVLDISAEVDFEHISIFDRNTVDPRLLDRRTDRRSGASNLGTGATDGRRRIAEGLEALNHPLTTDETMVLDAIRGDRRRRERQSQQPSDDPSRRSSSMSRAALLANFDDADTSRQRDRNPDARQSVTDLFSNHYRDPRDRAQARLLRRQQLLDATSQQQPMRRNDQRWTDRLADTMAAIRHDGSDASYRTVLELLQARERSSGAEVEDSSLLAPLVNPSARWEESAVRGTLPDHGVFDVPPSPDNTAGLAWSEDGRTL